MGLDVRDSSFALDGGEIKRCAERILVVEDETALSRLFCMVLSGEFPHCDIDTAENGEEAVELFSRSHHRVLLMDLHMPVMDGQTAFFEIRKLCGDREWEMPAVVFCTGFVPPNTVSKVIEEEPSHCLLSKPVSNSMIIDAVRERL